LRGERDVTLGESENQCSEEKGRAILPYRVRVNVLKKKSRIVNNNKTYQNNSSVNIMRDCALLQSVVLLLA
jgi:hypothetical protein